MGIYANHNASLLIEFNLFTDNQRGNDGGIILVEASSGTIRNNTIAFNDAATVYNTNLDVTLFPGNTLTIERNIIANNTGWGTNLDDVSIGGHITLACNDVWMNSWGDHPEWYVVPPGNFSLDPKFCDPATRDLTLQNTSPCLAGQHPPEATCGFIGRYEQGCQVIAVLPSTWSRIKRLGE